MQEDLAIPVGDAAVYRIAAHHRNDIRILLWLIFPGDFIFVGEVKSIDRVWKRCMNVHHVADDQRSTFMAAQHTGRKRPCHLQLANIGRGDLLKFRVARIGVVARRHYPILWVLRHLIQFVVGIGGACGECRYSAKTGCE